MVKEFVYLGVLLQSNGRFSRPQRRLAHQGRKACGYVNGDDVEVVHNTFCKRVLRVKK
jgi:hypothetical protein